MQQIIWILPSLTLGTESVLQNYQQKSAQVIWQVESLDSFSSEIV